MKIIAKFKLSSKMTLNFNFSFLKDNRNYVFIECESVHAIGMGLGHSFGHKEEKQSLVHALAKRRGKHGEDEVWRTPAPFLVE